MGGKNKYYSPGDLGTWEIALKYWFASIVEDNWNTIKELRIYASKNIVCRKMTKGDRIIVYIPKKASKTLGGCVVGVLELVTDIEYDTTPLFPEEKRTNKVLYPYRAKVKLIHEGKVPINEILPLLSFIENKEKFMIYLRGNPANMGRPIPDKDAEIIINKLIQSKS